MSRMPKGLLLPWAWELTTAMLQRKGGPTSIEKRFGRQQKAYNNYKTCVFFVLDSIAGLWYTHTSDISFDHCLPLFSGSLEICRRICE